MINVRTTYVVMLKLFVLSLLAISSCSGGSSTEDEPAVISQYRQKVLEFVGAYPKQEDPSTFNKDKIKFYLYTREVPRKHEVDVDYIESLYNSSYNVKRPVKILIHSWLSTEPKANELVAAYLRHEKEVVQVITVDYDMYTAANYYKFVKIIPNIGEQIGKLVKMLYSYGSLPEKMHIIGLGFGAHMAGATADFIFPMKVGRITGLDPIGLEFDNDKSLHQLKFYDAEFVDVIVTNKGELGTKFENRGKANFFPNGGIRQPGCLDIYENHFRSYYYFLESVVLKYTFKSYKAANYLDYLRNQTIPPPTFMGEYVDKSAQGKYYCNTNALPIYGKNPVPVPVVPQLPVPLDNSSEYVTLFPPMVVKPTPENYQPQESEPNESFSKAFREQRHAGRWFA